MGLAQERCLQFLPATTTTSRVKVNSLQVWDKASSPLNTLVGPLVTLTSTSQLGSRWSSSSSISISSRWLGTAPWLGPTRRASSLSSPLSYGRTPTDLYLLALPLYFCHLPFPSRCFSRVKSTWEDDPSTLAPRTIPLHSGLRSRVLARWNNRYQHVADRALFCCATWLVCILQVSLSVCRAFLGFNFGTGVCCC